MRKYDFESTLSPRLKAQARMAVKKFGTDNQLKKVLEELAELQTELSRMGTDRVDYVKILEEYVDVLMMLEQLYLIVGFKDVIVHMMFAKKLDKQLEILRGRK